MFEITDYGNVSPKEKYRGNLSDIAVILPAYNEERGIEKVVNKVTGELGLQKVFAVDDASDDNTPSILKGLSNKTKCLTVVTNPQNMGKGGAMKRGFTALINSHSAKGTKYVFVIDADMQFDPAYIMPLSNILNGNDVVIATRSWDEMTIKRRFANWYVNRFYKRVGLDVDVMCGLVGSTLEIARYRAENMNPTSRYGVEQEFFLQLAMYAYTHKKAIRIAKATVPCRYGDEKSKIRPKDVINLALTSYRNAREIRELQSKYRTKK